MENEVLLIHLPHRAAVGERLNRQLQLLAQHLLLQGKGFAQEGFSVDGGASFVGVD
jgi:hypothetical protein